MNNFDLLKAWTHFKKLEVDVSSDDLEFAKEISKAVDVAIWAETHAIPVLKSTLENIETNANAITATSADIRLLLKLFPS